jgi:hypothetical protein
MATASTLKKLLAEWQPAIWELKHEPEINNDHWIVYGYHEAHDKELRIEGKTPLEAMLNFITKMQYLDSTSPVDL